MEFTFWKGGLGKVPDQPGAAEATGDTILLSYLECAFFAPFCPGYLWPPRLPESKIGGEPVPV